jgi:zinc transporter 1/2/3
MIFVQSLMNPLGILVGWLLSGDGSLIEGVFKGISAGTFLYVATQEMIAQEFSISRFKYAKFLFFIIAFGFVSSLYFIQIAIGNE